MFRTETKDCQILLVENESPSFRCDPNAAFLKDYSQTWS